MNDYRTMDTKTPPEGIVMEKAEVIELSRADEQKALEFLMKQDLTGSIIADIAALGYAGQDRNKLLLYMIATSRKMENPLACIVTGESSAGKTHLAESIIKLIPPEEKEALTRATKQAFFYEDDLSHKLIYVREAAG